MTTAAIVRESRRDSAPPFRPSLLFQRALQFGVSYTDLTEVSECSEDWDRWSERLTLIAHKYAEAGDAAARDHHLHSAAEHWRRASAYYHFAQLRLTESNRKKQLQLKTRESFAKLAPLLQPTAKRMEIPFAGAKLVGYLREARPSAPLVVLIGGLDSAKEVEMLSFSDNFLERGLSAFFFDGPGQGEVSGKLPMNGSFESAVSAVLDFLEGMGAGCDGFGVFGVSFGGYLACRAAASDPRLRACVCLGGFFDGRILSRLPVIAEQILRSAFGLRSSEELSPVEMQITLEPLAGLMTRPLLVVHGCDDHLVDEEQIRRLEQWAAGPSRIWRVPRAEHVCTNRFAECLPVIADWMADNVQHDQMCIGTWGCGGVDVCPI